MSVIWYIVGGAILGLFLCGVVALALRRAAARVHTRAEHLFNDQRQKNRRRLS